jgi:hypothetical protein
LFSLWKRFKEYIKQNVGIDEANSLDDPSIDTPLHISAWIFIECDIPDPLNKIRMQCNDKTYSQALKMRAAVSFHYNELGRGSDRWHQGKDGSWMGNPSLSNKVSRYMLSLQRRKVYTFHINISRSQRYFNLKIVLLIPFCVGT